MEFLILGPLEVRAEGRSLPLGGRRQRSLLGLLLLHANQVASRDQLIDGIWGEAAPSTASRTLDSYVSRLRTVLGADRLVRREPGYALRVERDELDLTRFQDALEAGRSRLAEGDAESASRLLGEALDLWRGEPLADLVYEPFAASAVARLEDRRMLCVEERFDALLALGHASDLIPDLQSLVAEHPFREGLLRQLMLALYRAGRQADALAAYERGRQLLARELGLDPSPLLRDLQRRILEQDESLQLELPEEADAPVASSRGIRITLRGVGAVLACVVVAVVIGTELKTSGSRAGPTNPQSDRLVEIRGDSVDPAVETALPDAPSAAVAAAGSIWLAEPNIGALVRVDQASHQVSERIPVGGNAGAVAFGGGAVWVAGVPGENVLRVDPSTDKVTKRISLAPARASALAYGLGALWIADQTDDAVLKLDPATDTISDAVQLESSPDALAIGAGGIWVADYQGGTVTEVDPHTHLTDAIVRVGTGPTQLAIAGDSVWVANSLDSTVSRIDSSSDEVTVVPVGSDPVSLVASPTSVWVANEYSETVSRLDVETASVASDVKVGGAPTALVSANGRVWIGTRPLAQHRGGTLVLLHTRPLSIDPALDLDLSPFQSDGFTRDGLVTYDHTGGPAGDRLVPDLAVALPVPSDGGKAYTFRLRPGIVYSTGMPVRATDFRRALERLFRLGSPGASYFSNILGSSSCTRGSCDLSRGVVTNDRERSVTIHLVAPDPGLLDTLTIGGLATPVPPGTPFHNTGRTPIPGTGPYEIAASTPRELRYSRNPWFREWSHAAQPDGYADEIVMRYGLSATQEIRAVERGQADWTADGVPAHLRSEITTRFPALAHNFPETETDFLQLNTTVAPFNDVRVRQALNLAIDRRAVARFYGGAIAASPTCQILPPGLLGYKPYCPYTSMPTSAGRWRSPDLPRARRLIAASGTRGDRVTVWGPNDDPVLGQLVAPYAAGVLRALGYRARVHLIPSAAFGTMSQRAFRTIQMTPPAWADSGPYKFFVTWFECDAAYNHRWFCDPRVDKQIRRAEAVQAVDPRVGAALWARLDRELVNRAAWVPLVNPTSVDVVSTRVSNYEHNPILGVVADQLALK